MTKDHLVVILPHKLLLQDIERDEANQIVGAWVINGAWYFKVILGRQHALAGPKDHVSEETDIGCRPFREVIIPDDVRGDYNQLIEWARQQ